MSKFITPAEFALRPEACAVRVGRAAPDLANSCGRLISYVFSDTTVGRDNDVIAADAWDVAHFRNNPVFLWAHDSGSPPIGRVLDIGSRNGRLIGAVDYAERDVYPFADTIFQLVKAGFINATSVGFMPRAWKLSADRARPGGVDFSEVELLEISQVPVPALPTALVTARAQGIDTGPIFEWAERMLDASDLAVLPRAELEILRREARMPKSAKPVPASPEVSPAPEPEGRAADAPPPIKIVKRSLWHVGWLAMLLDDLGCLQDSTEYEAAIEEDGRAVPAQFLAALQALGQVLVAMTVEEVSELLAGDADQHETVGDVTVMAAGIDLKRGAFRALRRLDDGALAAVAWAMRAHLAGYRVSFSHREAAMPMQRAGKVLSAENERCLRDAHECMTRASDMVRSLVAKGADKDGCDDAGGNEDARNLRARKARALKLTVDPASIGKTFRS